MISKKEAERRLEEIAETAEDNSLSSDFKILGAMKKVKRCKRYEQNSILAEKYSKYINKVQDYAWVIESLDKTKKLMFYPTKNWGKDLKNKRKFYGNLTTAIKLITS